MIERIKKRSPESVAETFKRGDRVKLRSDIDREAYDKYSRDFIESDVRSDADYKVYFVQSGEDKEGPIIWVGPGDVNDDYIEGYRPNMSEAEATMRYTGVFCVPAKYLRKDTH